MIDLQNLHWLLHVQDISTSTNHRCSDTYGDIYILVIAEVFFELSLVFMSVFLFIKNKNPNPRFEGLGFVTRDQSVTTSPLMVVGSVFSVPFAEDALITLTIVAMCVPASNSSLVALCTDLPTV